VDAVARSWKLWVLVAAALGTYGFFQPFFTIDSVDLEVSAYRIVAGYQSLDEIGPERFGVRPDQRNTEYERETLRKVNDWVRSDHVAQFDWNTTVTQKSFVPYYFLSAALLLAIAFYAFVERKLRTSAAWVVLIASMPALWGFSRAWRGAMAYPEVHLGSGAVFLGATGVLAIAVGIAALVREDPGGFFKNAPTDDDEIVEELEDVHGRRTMRDPRDL